MAKAVKEFYFGTAFYAVDDDVPDEVAAQVSASVVDEQPYVEADVDLDAFDGEAFDAAVAAKVAQREQELAAEHATALEEAVQAAVAEQREREQAAYDVQAAVESPFDPAAQGVGAKDVHGYLSGLDRDTAAGAAEYARVVEAEQGGQNRSTAIPVDATADQS